ncbi:hypothetical protein ACF1DY_31880 [Streptomyces albus]|uniref:hypothetical protein n=1 Tax=Streptomyces albus TaxID=1888 RepID=UPI0036FC5274
MTSETSASTGRLPVRTPQEAARRLNEQNAGVLADRPPDLFRAPSRTTLQRLYQGLTRDQDEELNQ